MRSLLTILLFLIVSVASAQTVNDLPPTVTMKEYVDMQADLNQKLNEAQFQNVNDNVSKANMAMEKRLDGINEFRGQLKDQAATFITRGELFAWVVAIIGIFFGFSNYRNNLSKKSQGENIVSGDKVEVKK